MSDADDNAGLTANYILQRLAAIERRLKSIDASADTIAPNKKVREKSKISVIERFLIVLFLLVAVVAFLKGLGSNLANTYDKVSSAHQANITSGAK